MKVLVHLNSAMNKSYLLDFEKKLTKEDLLQLLEGDDVNGVESLMGYADAFLEPAQKLEVLPAEKHKAHFDADLVVGRAYTSERLA